MFGKITLFLGLVFGFVSVQTSSAQYLPLSGYATTGATAAKVSGLSSTNYLQGIIPSATICVYLTGTTNLATIYSDATGTPLSSCFTANNIASSNPGFWRFYAVGNIGLDVVGSGGIAPNTYPSPTTLLVNAFPGTGVGAFCPLSGCAFTGPISAPVISVTDKVTTGQNFGLVYYANQFPSGTWGGAWNGTTTYPACTAVTNGGQGWISGVSSTNITPGGTQGVWFPTNWTTTYTPSNLECADAQLLSKIDLLNSSNITLHVNSANYSVCGTLLMRDPNPVISGGSAPQFMLSIVGDGINNTRITQTCNTGFPLIYSPYVVGDHINASARHFKLGGFWANGGGFNGIYATIEVDAAAAKSQIFDIAVRSANGTATQGSATMRIGNDSVANNDAFLYEMSVHDIKIEANPAQSPYPAGNGASLYATLDGSGNPTYVITNGGHGFDSNTTIYNLGAAGLNGIGNSPCSTIGVNTPTIIGGVLTSVSSTASGCYGSISTTGLTVTLGTSPTNGTYNMSAGTADARGNTAVIQTVVSGCPGACVQTTTVTTPGVYLYNAVPTFTPNAGLGTGATIAVTLIMPVFAWDGENVAYGLWASAVSDSDWYGIVSYSGQTGCFRADHSNNTFYDMHIDCYGQWGIYNNNVNTYLGGNWGEAYQGQFMSFFPFTASGMRYGVSTLFPYQAVFTLRNNALGTSTIVASKVNDLICNSYGTQPTTIEFHTVATPNYVQDSTTVTAAANYFLPHLTALGYCGPTGWGSGINYFGSGLSLNGQLFTNGRISQTSTTPDGQDFRAGPFDGNNHGIAFANSTGYVGHNSLVGGNGGITYQDSHGNHQFDKGVSTTIANVTHQGGFDNGNCFSVGPTALASGTCTIANPFHVTAAGNATANSITLSAGTTLNAVSLATATCGTTAATVGATATCSISWGVTLANSTYKALCTLTGVTNLPAIVGTSSKTTTGVTVTIAALTAAAATGTAECSAFY